MYTYAYTYVVVHIYIYVYTHTMYHNIHICNISHLTLGDRCKVVGLSDAILPLAVDLSFGPLGLMHTGARACGAKPWGSKYPNIGPIYKC